MFLAGITPKFRNNLLQKQVFCNLFISARFDFTTTRDCRFTKTGSRISDN